VVAPKLRLKSEAGQSARLWTTANGAVVGVLCAEASRDDDGADVQAARPAASAVAAAMAIKREVMAMFLMGWPLPSRRAASPKRWWRPVFEPPEGF
jgi:hypothetical protein